MIGWKRFYRQKVVPSRPKLGTLSINYVTGLFEIKEAITKRENFNALFLSSQALTPNIEYSLSMASAISLDPILISFIIVLLQSRVYWEISLLQSDS